MRKILDFGHCSQVDGTRKNVMYCLDLSFSLWLCLVDEGVAEYPAEFISMPCIRCATARYRTAFQHPNVYQTLHVFYFCSGQARYLVRQFYNFFSFWTNKLRFLAKLPPTVKSELKIRPNLLV